MNKDNKLTEQQQSDSRYLDEAIGNTEIHIEELIDTTKALQEQLDLAKYYKKNIKDDDINDVTGTHALRTYAIINMLIVDLQKNDAVGHFVETMCKDYIDPPE